MENYGLTRAGLSTLEMKLELVESKMAHVKDQLRMVHGHEELTKDLQYELTNLYATMSYLDDAIDRGRSRVEWREKDMLNNHN
tara:strand:+ start:109 stop:357 length:249 start_codon:yes stop_codon:yes gene_type:complete